MQFSSGGVKLYISIPSISLLVYFALKLYQELSAENVNLFTNENKKFWLITIVVLCLWVLMSGIGSFMYQNSDFVARNPMYRDLCTYEWPVIYDLSQQSDAVKAITGSGTVAFSYYLTYWLPPALLSKIFSFDELGRNVSLYFYTVIGIFLTLYNLCRYFKKTSYAILTVFIFFSGMDVIGYVCQRILPDAAQANGSGYLKIFSVLIYEHFEWWAGLFQYSSNTSLLFWVFNQSVGVWLIVILFLQVRSNKNSLALSSLTFAYSAWAVFGMIPLALWSAFKIHKKFRDAFTLQNILIPLLILIVYGSFYLTGNGAQGKPFYLNVKNTEDLYVYALFILLEFGIYMLIMGKTAVKYDFYHVVLIELLLFPFYTFDGNLIMRETISTLFVLMVLVLKFLFEKDTSLRKRKIVLVIALAIGAYTPVSEMNRSIIGTTVHVLKEHNMLPNALAQKAQNLNVKFLRNELYTLGNLTVFDNEELIRGYKNTFFAYGYEDSFFFKYLAK